MAIVDRLGAFDNIVIPYFVIGEMMVGFSNASANKKARNDFETFLAHTKIVECDRNVADSYGKIFVELRNQGAIIPVNDIWIAACCITAGVPLATRDNHFKRIPELKTEMW